MSNHLGKDFTDKFIMNTAVMITLVSFLFMISGCSYYKPVTKVKEGSGNLLTETLNKLYPESDYPRDRFPEANLQKMFFMDHVIFAVERKGMWKLSGVEIINDTLYATAEMSILPLDSIAEKGNNVRYHPAEESALLKNVLIYTYTFEKIVGGKACFSLGDISKIVLFKDDPGPKLGVTLLILGGIATLTLVTLFWIAVSGNL